MTLRLMLLFFSWLVAGAVLAQPGVTGGGVAESRSGAAESRSATVDSRSECSALQGKWEVAADGWRAACEVPWSRGDCLRLGGSWTQVNKAATGGRCLAPVSEWAAATQCLDRGGQWTPAGARPASCTVIPTRVPGRTPPAMASDAGKRCDSQKECLNGCVYQGPETAPGVAVAGRCRAAKVAAGCFTMVEGGRVAGNICVK
jgi:hypothetical protein